MDKTPKFQNISLPLEAPSIPSSRTKQILLQICRCRPSGPPPPTSHIYPKVGLVFPKWLPNLVGIPVVDETLPTTTNSSAIANLPVLLVNQEWSKIGRGWVWVLDFSGGKKMKERMGLCLWTLHDHGAFVILQGDERLGSGHARPGGIDGPSNPHVRGRWRRDEG